MNSEQGIWHLVWAITARAALPKGGFSSPAQASFFLICVGNSTNAGYCPHIMPRPAFWASLVFSGFCATILLKPEKICKIFEKVVKVAKELIFLGKCIFWNCRNQLILTSQELLESMLKIIFIVFLLASTKKEEIHRKNC